MKVTKSLLLGAAAGFVAMSGAQAADLPVKAKPVEYVKICSAYGAGFYYIPGTDICLRVGGYVFVETGVKGRNAAVDVIYTGTAGSNNGRQLEPRRQLPQWRARGHVILDARNNTAYGTLRAYFVGGISYATTVGPVQDAGANTGASMDRAFIQFAGFTAGFTESFFSFGGAYSIVAGGAFAVGLAPAHRLHGAARQRRLGHAFGRRRRRRGAATSGKCPVRGRAASVPPCSVATVVNKYPTSSRTSASTRLGARRRSWAPCTKCGANTRAGEQRRGRQVGLCVRRRFRNQDAADG